MRTVQDLSRKEIESILQDANRRCYAEIAEEVDVPVYTIRKVIRQHNNQLRRYQLTDKGHNHQKRNTVRL